MQSELTAISEDIAGGVGSVDIVDIAGGVDGVDIAGSSDVERAKPTTLPAVMLSESTRRAFASIVPLNAESDCDESLDS